MALTSFQIRRACSSTRYASPTRYITATSRSTEQECQLAIFQARTGNEQRKHQSRQSHFLSKNCSFPNLVSEKENILGLKTWNKDEGASRKYLASVSKMIGYLNIDLPKPSINFQRFIPVSVLRKQVKSSEQTAVSVITVPEKDSHQEKEEDVLKTSANAAEIVPEEENQCTGIHSEEERHQLIARLRLKSHRMVDREQHDFEQAMTDTYQSITYAKPPQTTSLTLTSQPKPDSRKDTKSMTDTVYNTTSRIASSTGNLVKSVTNMLPSLDTSKSKSQSVLQKEEAQQIKIMRRENLARGSADRKTKGLVLALRASTSNISRLRRLEEFCKHMADYPSTRGKAVKVGVLSTWEDSYNHNVAFLIMQTLLRASDFFFN